MLRLLKYPPGPVTRRVALQAGLLLALAAALAAFFLLLNLLVPLVSSGPDDILAVNPSDEDEIGLPTGVGLLAFGIVAVSVILGMTALFASRRWPPSRGRIRPFLPLLASGLAAASLVGAGVYVVLSGILAQDIAYDQHQATRTLLEPIGLAVLAAFFLSISITGILRPKLLLPLLIVWLVASLVFGFLNTRPLDGLRLFQRPAALEEPESYASIVERYLHPDVAEAAGTEAPSPLKTEQVSLSPPTPPAGPASKPDVSLATTVTALQMVEGPRQPVFRVEGAFRTRYLRTSSGDVYRDGQWAQLEHPSIAVDPTTIVPDALAVFAAELNDGLSAASPVSPPAASPTLPHSALLAPPLLTPFVVDTDTISVEPAGEFGGFQAGVLPSSKDLQQTNIEGEYHPFNAILSSPVPVSSYQWRSAVYVFSLADLIGADVIDDATYLQLPEDLPGRIHE